MDWAVAWMPTDAQIPKGWRLARLGDVLSLQYGVSLPERARKEGKVPVVGSAGIVGFHNQATVKGPGIVVGRKGSIGSISWIDEDFVPIDTTYFVVPINGQVDLRWAYYELSRENLSRLNRATGIPGLNRDDVFALERCIPPLPEQRAIAAVLDAIDAAIESAGAVIAATEQLRDSLLHQLLSRGLPGWHTQWQEAPGLGTIPAAWQVVRLGEVAEVTFSSVDKKVVESEVPVRLCNYTDVFYNRRIRSNMAFMEATANPVEIQRWTLKRGDVLFTKDSETPDEIGIPAFVETDMPDVLCGYHLGLARPNRRTLDGAYLAEAFGSRKLAAQFARIANGVTRFGLTLGATSQLPIPLPPLSEQQAMAELLDGVDETIAGAKRERDGLQLLKESTADALLTGRVRVGAAEGV